MKPDKDYTDAVNSLVSRIVDVSKHKIGGKQIPFTDVMFICAETLAPARTSPWVWL